MLALHGLVSQLARMLSRHTRLYTEMIVTSTMWHNPGLTHTELSFDPKQHPIALQVGGSDPLLLAYGARLAALYGYDEVNLNCGCPSERVANAGCFGAALMLEPALVQECCEKMIAAVESTGRRCAVTVKCRLGADGMDSYEEFVEFARHVARAGVKHLIVHSRKCWLRGLSPKDNRSVPPLRPEWVLRLCTEEFVKDAGMRVSINGGIRTFEHAGQLLSVKPLAAPPAEETPGSTSSTAEESAARAEKRPMAAERPAGKRSKLEYLATSTATAHYDGPYLWDPPIAEETHPLPASLATGEPWEGGLLESVMVGRGAYELWRFSDADRSVFGVPNPVESRKQVIEDYLREYAEPRLRQSMCEAGNRLTALHRMRGLRTDLVKPILLLVRMIPYSNKLRHALTVALNEDRAHCRKLLQDERQRLRELGELHDDEGKVVGKPLPTTMEEVLSAPLPIPPVVSAEAEAMATELLSEMKPLSVLVGEALAIAQEGTLEEGPPEFGSPEWFEPAERVM
jgi:tRNA-dihydrouridine synthase